MDKETLLQKYIDIETKTYVRSEKTQKLNDLINTITAEGYILTLTDTLSIVNTLLETRTALRNPFFSHIIYPVLLKGVDGHDIKAIKLLIKLFEQENLPNLIKDHKYSTRTLLLKGLERSPHDKELLVMYEQQQESYFEYTLHELPSGVLYGTNGATVEQCDKLLYELCAYEKACTKLNIDKQILINKCRLYYNAYMSYLTGSENYNSFADYLVQQGM